MPLTPRQADVLQAVAALTSEKGYPPTVAEIAQRWKCAPSAPTSI